MPQKNQKKKKKYFSGDEVCFGNEPSILVKDWMINKNLHQLIGAIHI